MKTLREYIDQLDEISRRDFLKGAGATAALAGAGALGYKSGQDTIPEEKKKYFNPRLWYLTGYIFSDYLEGYDRNVFNSIASEVNGILRNTPQWSDYVHTNQQGHEALWRDIKEQRLKMGLPDLPLAQQEEKFKPWISQRMKTAFNEVKKLVGYMDESTELEENSEEAIARIIELSKNK
jgi:hypothetical protein